jgi:hypothetical protein|nr:MAG TPA: hypothetical protein [Caudoviricetes sp.]
MANVKLQIRGREALQQKLNEKREQLIKVLNVRLMQLAEEAVTYSKDNKGYQDRTANLKNSISFALYLDGEIVTSKIGAIPKAEEVVGGQDAVGEALQNYAQQEGVVAPKGYSLIIVAGMNYGKYVEDKGYNVLHLTKYYLRSEMKKIFEEVIEMIKGV